MSARSSRNSSRATPSTTEGRHRHTASTERRGLGLLVTVPLVLISTIAISLNLASPADAATSAKKPLKSKSLLPGAVPAVLPTNVSAATAPTQYQVVEGDTVSAVAGRFGLSTASVLALNGLGWSAVIFPGQTLTLSAQAATPAPAPAPVAAEITRYLIQSGDTLSGVAAAHGLPLSALLQVNGLDASSIIFPGQAVVLPPGNAAEPAPVAAVAAVAAVQSSAGTHTIMAGETIGGLAAAAGVSVQSVLDANGLGWSSIIYPGQVLSMPSGSSPAALPIDPAVLFEPVAPAPSPSAEVGRVTPLTEEMRHHAEIIIASGRTAGAADAGIVIALAAAAQESGLRNVQHGDRDSLGLFQQRPSSGWGSRDEVLDPVRASLAFFGGPVNPNPGVTRGLLDVPGWESMTVTEAAQAVQISAYPNHYAKWETSARAWLDELG
ncbi:lytic transglycosylase [Cryobacterium cryoconiti]|uniref:LysM peptidoglycan-binding domain-containing protein n=1 Tax=Cryobacterium cryoconiti TaxID=1259239 RepID=A0A4Y8JZM6_9MICO|nr:LysM peptidoglycan-binding domain-containing protein [Cryobacterium cryoconiti]TFD33120.1 LysM peptidoglycan-binding domain-containing protein [Cryobacterium cryoconiti]